MTMRRRIASRAVALALPLVLAAPGFAQSTDDDLRRDIDALKQGQRQIQQQLRSIEQLLKTRPAAPAAPSGPNVRDKIFELRDNPVKGENTAPLTLVDFTDYQ